MRIEKKVLKENGEIAYYVNFYVDSSYQLKEGETIASRDDDGYYEKEPSLEEKLDNAQAAWSLGAGNHKEIEELKYKIKIRDLGT